MAGIDNIIPHQFKPGNTAACGYSYDPEDECKKLDEWSKLDDSFALIEYAAWRGTYPQKVYELRDRHPAFAEILNIAKARLAARQRKLLHKDEYNYGLFMREIGFHDKFLNDYESSEKDKDVARAKESGQNIGQGFVEALQSNLAMVEEVRQSRSKRSKVDSNIIKDK